MTTANLTIEATGSSGEMLSRTIEVELIENAAGRVILKGTDAVIEVADLCGGESKIKDALPLALRAHARKPALYGSVTPIGKSKPVPMEMPLDGRPLHRELYDCAIAIMDAYWAARQSIADEYAAEKEAAGTKDFPAGAVRVRFLRSEADGWVEIWADDEDRTIRSPKLGGRNGTWGWMTDADHAAAVKPEPPKPAKPAVDLLAVEVPADAIEAFKRYRGDADAAWDDEAETAAVLISRYADAIEAQGLAYPGATVIKRAMRSDEMGTHEG